MQRKIAVEEGLGSVRAYLEENGYETTTLHGDQKQAAVIVVSGLDTNPLGDTTTTSRTPVVSAAGLSAEEVLAEVERRLQLQH